MNRAERLQREIENNIEVRQPKGINPFSSLVESLCQVQRVGTAELPRPGAALRIALVSMPALRPGVDFEITRKSHVGRVPAGVSTEDCERRIVSLRSGASERLLAAYKAALNFAVTRYRANVICVSELGLPQRATLPLAEAQQFARDFSAAHGVLVIGGTSHDARTHYNTGYLYHRGSGWPFHKTLSAIGMGERVASPSLRRVLTIKTFDLRIAVLICLDIADYATLASVIRVKDKVDVILVPCYTLKFDKMLEVAKTASKALRGIVAMVNTHVPNSTCHIARFGDDEEPAQRHELRSGAVVSLFQIAYKKFEREQASEQRNSDCREVDWLFGNHDLPYVLPKPTVKRKRRSVDTQ